MPRDSRNPRSRPQAPEHHPHQWCAELRFAAGAPANHDRSQRQPLYRCSL